MAGVVPTPYEPDWPAILTHNRTRFAARLSSSINEAGAADRLPCSIFNGQQLPKVRRDSPPSAAVAWFAFGERPHMQAVNIENVNQLLAFRGDDFVEMAYRVILGREADTLGKRHYGSRAVTVRDKAVIVYELASSPEAQSRSLQLSGLTELVRLYEPRSGRLARWLQRLSQGLAAVHRTERTLDLIGAEADAQRQETVALLSSILSQAHNQSAGLCHLIEVLSRSSSVDYRNSTARLETIQSQLSLQTVAVNKLLDDSHAMKGKSEEEAQCRQAAEARITATERELTRRAQLDTELLAQITAQTDARLQATETRMAAIEAAMERQLNAMGRLIAVVETLKGTFRAVVHAPRSINTDDPSQFHDDSAKSALLPSALSLRLDASAGVDRLLDDLKSGLQSCSEAMLLARERRG